MAPSERNVGVDGDAEDEKKQEIEFHGLWSFAHSERPREAGGFFFNQIKGKNG
jgi:hypothetical protein